MAEAHSPREIPPEIIFCNILPRLPAKSLPCFMLVSKEWHSFIKTPLFEKLHLHHATNDHHQNNLRFLLFSEAKYKERRNTFNASDYEALDQDGLTASQPFPFKAHDGDIENISILASVGGLVCVGITKRSYLSDNYSDLILWNPLTGDYKTLSKPDNSSEDCYQKHHQRAYGLYYNSCDDDFKLLCVTHNLNAYIYSLNSDAWRRVVDSTKEHLKCIAAYQHPDIWPWPSIALNEKLYFLKYYGKDSTRGSIIRFDTKTEKFTEISTPCFHLFPLVPSFIRWPKDVFLSLTVLRGRIHFFVIYFTNCRESAREWQHVECWSMDEDGNWIREVTFPKASSYIIIEPLHQVNNGEQIQGSSYDGRAWKLDLTRHVIKDISSLRYSSTLKRHVYIPRSGKYTQTLVSPNRRYDVRQPLN